jgi:hypothetical protein
MLAAARHGFAGTGPGRQFANPAGTDPDPVNGFGGSGRGLMVSGTSLSVALPCSAHPPTYQVRVFALSPTGQPVGVFGDAVTVIVEWLTGPEANAT